jgi:hypothetical protein
VTQAIVGDGYVEYHLALERAGNIRHAWRDTETVALQQYRYWADGRWRP